MKIKSQKLKKGLAILLILLILLSTLKFLIFKPKIALADSTLGFNEGYGTTINDNNGNITGTITNAVWKNEDLCKFGKCLYFDGTGDLINYGDDVDLDFVAATNFTVEGWFRTPDITSGTRVLVAKYNSATGTDGGYKVYMDSNGYLIFGIDDDQTSFPEDSASTSTTAFDDNKWHHFAAVKTGTTSISLYVDGVLYQTDSSISATGTLANSDTFYNGIDGDGSSNGFTGFLDEIKIYTTSARTLAEIQSDFTGQTNSRGTAALFGSDNSYLTDGLVGYWKFDESSGNAADSSGVGTTLTNVSTTAYTGARFGNGMEPDGTADYFQASDNSSLSITGNVTLSAWINPDTVTGSRDIIAKWDGANESYLLANEGANLRMYIDSSSNYEASTGSPIIINTLQHVAGVYNATTRTVKLYVNGLLVTSSTTGTIPSSIADDAGRIQIGSEDSTTAATNFFDGHIDDARIYNKSLTPEQIYDLYNWGPNPSGYWNMDENTGTTLQDTSTNGYVSTTFSNASWATGKYGSALSFNGSNNSVVRITEGTFIDLAPLTASLTVSAWIKTSTNFSTNAAIVNKYNATTTLAYAIYLNSSEQACIQMADGTSTPTACGTVALNDGNWHHISGVRDRNDLNLYMYVDGVLVGTTTDNLVATTANPDDVSIGNGGTSYTAFDFTGTIDDVKIYNYARTNKQIIEDMNAGHPAPNSPHTSAVGYWKLDEGYGTSANDSSPFSNNLTLSTASWTTSGKFNTAWNGTGSNPHLSRADDPDFDFGSGQDFTLSLWTKSDSTSNPGASEYLIDKQVATNNPGYSLRFNTSGQVVCEFDDDTSSFPEDSATTSADYYDNTWHHITCVRDIERDKVYLYIDGIYSTEDSDISATGDLSNTDSLTIGAQDTTAGGTDDFSGDIDEIKIFRSALTPENILVLFNQSSSQNLGATTNTTDSYCPPGQGSCTGPSANWNLDENTGTTANDISGSGYTGTISGNPLWSSGKYGSALKFDRNGDYVNQTSLRIAENSAFTISGWFKSASTHVADNLNIYCEANSGDTRYACISLNHGATLGAIGVDIAGASGTSSFSFNASANNGAWHHFALVQSSASNRTLYIDGISKATNTTNVGSITLNNSTIGAYNGSGVTDYFEGDIDEIKLYNYARTQAQIAWEYNKGVAQAYWKFDENTGTTANDSSGNGLNSQTFQGNTTWTTGKLNTALTFDGTGDYVLVSDNNTLDITADFTLSAWVSKNSSGNSYIISKTNDSADGGYALLIGNAGEVYCRTNNGTSSTDSYTPTGLILNDSTWYHLAAIRSGTNCNVYINGTNATTTTNTHTTLTANNNNLAIGSQPSGGNYINGKIDDVRIFNYALTEKQLKAVMSGGGAVKF